MTKARRIGRGDLAGPIHIRSRDELAELAEDLNAMCLNLAESQRKLREESAARIAAIEQLRHADRLKTVGRLASGIAHELGTPLNVVAGRAGLIASGKLDAAEIAQSAAAIRSEADKMTRDYPPTAGFRPHRHAPQAADRPAQRRSADDRPAECDCRKAEGAAAT